MILSGSCKITAMTLVAFLSLNSYSQLGIFNKEVKNSPTHQVVEIQKDDQLQKQEVKNIIYLIGDGMSIEHIGAALVANKWKLNIEQCSVTGIIKTNSANAVITDSAAGGTALAAGTKTNNGVIGKDKDGKDLESILVVAQQQKKATGLIVTKAITDATSAAFYAHNISRNNEDAIAIDLLNRKVDVIMGGGKKHFSKRGDKRDLLQEFATAGYLIANSLDECKAEHTKPIIFLTADKHMKQPSKRGDYLASATKIALDKLSKSLNGFFLMIEGSKIDSESHENNMKETLAEVLDFDKAIGVALKFASENSGTLVVITADHCTGGLTVKDGSLGSGRVKGDWTSLNHTGVLVPLYAYGAQAQEFTGFYDNTKIPQKMKQLIQKKK